MKKQDTVLYIDLDDVLIDFNTSLLRFLNKQFSPDLCFSTEDINDWNYTRIRRLIKQKKGIEFGADTLLQTFLSCAFLSGEGLPNTLYPQACQFIKAANKMGHLTFVTELFRFSEKEQQWNEIQKREKQAILRKAFGEPVMRKSTEFFITYPNTKQQIIAQDLKERKKKNKVFSIQIDDNYSKLSNEVDLKILITNGRVTNYNTCYYNDDKLYVVYDLSEAQSIIEFFTKYDYYTLNKKGWMNSLMRKTGII